MNVLGTATLALALSASLDLWAGEAIQFSNSRSRPDPNQKTNLLQEPARRGLNFGGARGPIEGVMPGGAQPRRRDWRAERQARNAEDERKNWMVLDPGQLDAEDEENGIFGTKEYDPDKDGKRNYFFDSRGDRGANSRAPLGLGGVPGKNRNASEGIARSGSRGSDLDDKEAKGNQPGARDGREVGSHVSKEMDMKDLLAPGKANSLAPAPAEDKTTKLWNDILGTGATESREDISVRRESGSAPDGFRPSAGSSTPGRAPGSTPSFGFRNDFGTRSSAAGSPALSGSASTGFTPPAMSPVPRTAPEPSLSRPASPLTTGRVPTPSEASGARPSGFGSGSPGSPYGQPSQPARRPPSSGFEMPARPGYGGR